MSIVKNRDKFYVDALSRIQKSETVLSLIQATYHTRNVDQNERRNKIAERLVAAYDLFKDNARGSDTGSGTYNNNDGQFDSQYTIGHEMGIWINSNLELSPLANKVGKNEITIREYFNIVLLNLFQVVKGYGCNILYIILKEVKDENKNKVTKEIIKNALSKVVQEDVKNSVVNGFYEFLKGTTYFNEDSGGLILNENIDVLLEKCNLKYHEKSFDEIDEDIKTREEYALYLATDLSNKETDQVSEFSRKVITDPHQRIFFGAPGTGKSFNLKNEALEKFPTTYERVTFHPNFMYGNFIGAYKPFPVKLMKDKDTVLTDEFGNEKEQITYKYVPGALMRVLVKALLNPEENFLLLIEEINRANVTAVFGDFFQLLDRDGITGESEYPITTSEEVKKYLSEEFEGIDEKTKNYINSKLGNDYEHLILPSNLYIWATMNSADQGVMPMDTAFKRRWDFEYIGVDDNSEQIMGLYPFKISADKMMTWNEFRIQVNDRLSKCRVPEDKLLGPYFISKSILSKSNPEELAKVIKNKVLMYIYEDAGKPYRQNLFVSEKATTFSNLCKNFDENGLAIFKESLVLNDDIVQNDNNLNV